MPLIIFLFTFNLQKIMKLNAPKQLTWLIAILLGALGVLGVFVALPFISFNPLWFAVAGLALLAIANFVKGL